MFAYDTGNRVSKSTSRKTDYDSDPLAGIGLRRGLSEQGYRREGKRY
jgi:hypothetical protein